MEWFNFSWRLFGGLFFLALAWREYRRRPTSKVWILGVIAGIGFLLAAFLNL